MNVVHPMHHSELQTKNFNMRPCSAAVQGLVKHFDRIDCSQAIRSRPSFWPPNNSNKSKVWTKLLQWRIFRSILKERRACQSIESAIIWAILCELQNFALQMAIIRAATASTSCNSIHGMRGHYPAGIIIGHIVMGDQKFTLNGANLFVHCRKYPIGSINSGEDQEKEHLSRSHDSRCTVNQLVSPWLVGLLN